MKTGDLFATRIADKIDPVIKVSETTDEHKLAGEIGSYVVTPFIEQHLDNFLDHYTATFLLQTTEIGVWLSGYFGSGKSHLAKMLALVTENRSLAGVSAADRFAKRLAPDSPRRTTIVRSLSRLTQCDTRVLAFNLNTLTDSRDRPLPQLLYSQFFQAKGYCANLMYAKVIEAEFGRQGKLQQLHDAVCARTKKTWDDIRRNPGFYQRPLAEAACELAPQMFPTVADVNRAIENERTGGLLSVKALVAEMVQDLEQRKREQHKPQRLIMVLDESGQWIENDANRLAQLQALIEEAASVGQGRIWLVVTTHGDMAAVYKEARVVEGDMKKIEGRFRFKIGLTTENIERVLEDRLFRKTPEATQQLNDLYDRRGGALAGLGVLANTAQTLPVCTKDCFATYYPFFPYQAHLIPEIVKSLRSKGGRGEQLSGSTRTLLAITQDILRVGRRGYLDAGVGILVSFDEVYYNLCGEGEVNPDVRTELSRLHTVVAGATPLTTRVAEVLYLIREIAFIPRTKDNLARLLAEDANDDVAAVIARIEPELQRLMSAKMVAQVGEEYEFLTGERRTFEEEVARTEHDLRQQDRENGLRAGFVYDADKRRGQWRQWLGFERVGHLNQDFDFRLYVDDFAVPGMDGDIAVMVYSPLAARGSVKLPDLESRSLLPDAQNTVYVLSDAVTGFDRDINRWLAMKEVIHAWNSDNRKGDDAHKLAQERETKDLPKLEAKVLGAMRDGLKGGWVVFRGSSHSITVRPGQTPGEGLRSELSSFWPILYPKFDRVPIRISNDQRAIAEALEGRGSSADLAPLKLFDAAGKLNPSSPLLDALRVHLATEQGQGRRVLGKDLTTHFGRPPYGWDPNAVRAGVAAMVRHGVVKVVSNKKTYTNPADAQLRDLLRVSRSFDRVELVLEAADVPSETLADVRTFLMNLARRKGLDETPAALSEFAGEMAVELRRQSDSVKLWASGSGLCPPQAFTRGAELWQEVGELANPVQRVLKIHQSRTELAAGKTAVEQLDSFVGQFKQVYVDLANLVHSVEALAPLFPANGPTRQLLTAFAAAAHDQRVTEAETWRHLHSLKGQAELELQSLAAGWREEATGIVQKALTALPARLESLHLPADSAAVLGAPLLAFVQAVPEANAPAQAATLPDQARSHVRALEQAVRAAAAQPKPGGPPPAEPIPAQHLRLADAVSRRSVASEAEWDEVRDDLDAKVRDLLRHGFTVELD